MYKNYFRELRIVIESGEFTMKIDIEGGEVAEYVVNVLHGNPLSMEVFSLS